MIRNFASYNVIVEQRPFEKNDLHTAQTAVIQLLDADNKLLETVEMGYYQGSDLYNMIDSKQWIKLDNCFIRDFSMTEYRKQRGLMNKTVVQLPLLSARDAFFEHQTTLDFSYTEFTIADFYFNNTVCSAPRINLYGARFGQGNIFFEYMLFRSPMVEFTRCVFDKGDVSFKNTIFSEGEKHFDEITFGEGTLSFTGTEFGKGDVLFAGTNFNSGRVSFKAATFSDGKIDFNHSMFGDGEITFEKTIFGNGNVSFRSAKFGEGKTDFMRAEFGEGDISFINTEFGNGTVSFTNTNFGKGKVSFKLSVFGGGKVDFHYAKFADGDVSFERTFFGNGEVDFRATDFGTGRVTFAKADFGKGDISFEASELKDGEIVFRGTMFGNGVFDFQNARYDNADLEIDDVDFGQGKVSFRNSRFRTLSLKACQINNYFDLRLERCQLLDLSESIVKDIIDIRPPDKNAKIDGIDMSGVRLIGKIYIDWRENNVKDLIYKQTHSNRDKSEQFRILKQNYNALGQYDYEDEAYIEFKRTELKADLQYHLKQNPNNKYWAYPKAAFQWLLFDKVGKYATDPLRVLFSMLIVYVGFSLLYWFMIAVGWGTLFSSAPDVAEMSIAAQSFYFAVITFFTIGYGDFFPTGFMRPIAGIEGFTGVFLMSYFTVAFVRKILR